MKYNIYFHIDELARDAVTASALKFLFSRSDVRLFYGNRVYTDMVLPHCQNMFDLLIFPRPFFIPEKINSNNVIILFAEAVGRYFTSEKYALVSILDKDFMEGKKSNYDKVLKFLLWGDKSYNLITKKFPNVKEKFTVVGNPRHDNLALKNHTNNENNKKISVGFITRQPRINDCFGIQPINTILDVTMMKEYKYSYYNNENDYLLLQDDDPVDEMYVQSSDVRTMLNIIKKLNVDKFDISIRVHPTENFYFWENVLIKHSINATLSKWTTPFTHWASSKDYIVGPASTSSYDAYVVGAIPICTRYIDKKREAHISSFSEEFGALQDFVAKPRSIDELIESIKSKPTLELNSKIKQVLKDETNFPESSKSIDKIVSICMDELSLLNTNVKISKRRYAYFKYSLLTFFINIYFIYREKVRRKKIISCMFPINKKITKHIDNLLS